MSMDRQLRSACRLHLVLACASFLALAGCGSGSALESQRQSILGGVPSNRTAVVAVFNIDELCTGALIDVDLVLTARHCVSHLSGIGCAAKRTGEYALKELGVTSDSVSMSINPFSLPYEAVAELSFLPSPDGEALCGGDIALLRLAQPVVGIVPLEPRLDAPPQVGEPVTAVGYGRSVGDNPDSAGTRLEFAGAKVSLVGAASYPDGSPRRTDGEWAIDKGPCYGDSGSPALAADGRTLGVMSRGAGAVCTDMTYERLDVHADWLRGRVRAAAARAGRAPPAWALVHSAAFGEGCVRADQCVDGLTCLQVGDASRCTSADCASCQSDWKCGSEGYCVPPELVPAPAHGCGASGSSAPLALASALAVFACARRRRST